MRELGRLSKPIIVRRSSLFAFAKAILVSAKFRFGFPSTVLCKTSSYNPRWGSSMCKWSGVFLATRRMSPNEPSPLTRCTASVSTSACLRLGIDRQALVDLRKLRFKTVASVPVSGCHGIAGFSRVIEFSWQHFLSSLLDCSVAIVTSK